MANDQTVEQILQHVTQSMPGSQSQYFSLCRV